MVVIDDERENGEKGTGVPRWREERGGEGNEGCLGLRAEDAGIAMVG